MLPGTTTISSSIWAWVLTGITLDAVALSGIWKAIDSLGPLFVLTQFWLDVMGVVVVPWFVHCNALPAILSVRPISVAKIGHFMLYSYLYIMVAFFVVPALGCVVLMFTLFPVLFLATTIFSDHNNQTSYINLTWPDRISRYFIFLFAVMIFGSILGVMINIVRTFRNYDPETASFTWKNVRPDLLGGAIGALLLFIGAFVASALEQFYPEANALGHGAGDLVAVPQFPSAILIGIVALFPHLLMVGLVRYRANRVP